MRFGLANKSLLMEQVGEAQANFTRGRLKLGRFAQVIQRLLLLLQPCPGTSAEPKSVRVARLPIEHCLGIRSCFVEAKRGEASLGQRLKNPQAIRRVALSPPLPDGFLR